MARKSYWIKVLNSYLDDPRYMRLTDTAKALYFELYLLASKSDAYGFVLDTNDQPATIADIAFLLHRDDSIVKLGISELEAVQLISVDHDGVCVTRYADEQPNREEIREQWRERQERHREKEKESNKEKEKDLKDLKTDKESESESESDSHKHVTQESQNVTRDNKNNDADDEIAELILYHFEQTTQKKANKTPAFYAMVERLKAGGVTPGKVRNGFNDFKRKGGGVLKDITSAESWILNAKLGWNERMPGEVETQEANPELRALIEQHMAERGQQPEQEQTIQDEDMPF